MHLSPIVKRAIPVVVASALGAGALFLVAAPAPAALRPTARATVQASAPKPATSLQPRQTAAATPASTACDNHVDINLSTQELVAYACRRVFISTPITSGRPGLRTPAGTFAIFLKEENVTFNSPWPPGDPNYYPPMFVAYAVEFLEGGYFLHTDPDQPASTFGPGSENSRYASHGCVHVPYPAMVSLYNWATDGMVVSIHY